MLNLDAGNNWKGFPFLFALCTAASLVIWFGVDVEKGRRDAVSFAAAYRTDGARIAAIASDESGELGARKLVSSSGSFDDAKDRNQ